MYTVFSPSPTKELEKEFKRVIQEAKNTKDSGNEGLYTTKMREAKRIAKKIARKTLIG